MRYRVILILSLGLGLFFAFPQFAGASFAQDIINFLVSVKEVKISQESFKFYSPFKGLDPVDPWPPGQFNLPENTIINETGFPALFGSVLRLRIGLKITNTDLPASNRQFKLQFAKVPFGACPTTANWVDLGDPGSSALWRGFDASNLNDGAAITSNLLFGAEVKGSYEEKNPTAANPAVAENKLVEYDWFIQNNNSSPDGSDFCFRMINAGGAAFQTYTRYAKLDLPIGNQGTTSAMIDKSVGGTLALTNSDNTRMSLVAPANYLAASATFQIFSFNFSSYLDSVGSQPVGKVGANSFIYRMDAAINSFSSHSFDQDMTLQINYSDSDVGSVDEGSLQIFKYDGSSWSGLTTTVNTATNVATATVNSFSSFGLFGNSSGSSSSSSSSSGGGGGGGGSAFPYGVASIYIKGRAYPNSTVTLLKDAQLVGRFKADRNGNFEIQQSGLTGGGYNFSLQAQDQFNLRSNNYSFFLNIIANSANNVFGVLLPPTIAVNQEVFKPGETIRVFGSSVPDSFVILEVRSEPKILTAKSSAGGLYAQQLAAADLAKGPHNVKAKIKVAQGDESIFSNVIPFGVGVKPTGKLIGDLNNDGRINIVDFSILAFWYRKQAFPKNLDLNDDGKIDIADFSIVAYNWTG